MMQIFHFKDRRSLPRRLVLVIVLLPVIAYLLNFVGHYDLLTFGGHSAEFNFIALYLEFLLVVIILEFEFTRLTNEQQLAELKRTADERAPAEILSQDDFYSRFKREIEDANRTVDAAHLDSASPLTYQLRGSTTANYYTSIIELMRNRRQVQFRRVERASREKREWFQQLVNGLNGCENFSLAVLHADDNGRLPHVSVQIVDAKKVFIVAVAQHDVAHGPRDILISDERAARIWGDYYNSMLWQNSTPVIDRGRVVNERELRRLIGG